MVNHGLAMLAIIAVYSHHDKRTLTLTLTVIIIQLPIVRLFLTNSLFLGHQRLVPFYQNNSVGSNRDGMFASLEPAGNYRFSGQSRYQQRNDYTDHFANRNQQTDNPLRYDVRQSSGVTNDEDAEPLWFSAGPTSPNDCIELHGFDGPEHQENREGHPRNDQFGCVDGNISGGPTSGASSNNGSPPAKSTPAKVTFMNGKIYAKFHILDFLSFYSLCLRTFLLKIKDSTGVHSNLRS